MAVDFTKKDSYTIEDLRAILKVLRGEGGCPWDREQTHASIRNNFIEETYEAVEAIDNGDTALLKEELGDVLLQVVFHSAMEEEAGNFDFDDVANGICQKLILRHPHIFADGTAGTAEQVLDVWDDIKREEKHQETYTETLKSVPKVFPSLMRAYKVSKRARKSGFDYPDVNWAISDLFSEVEELKQAITLGDAAACNEELGDVLFSAANVARFLKIDPEESLHYSTSKFISRFERVEQMARQRGIDMSSSTTDMLIGLWKEAKDKE